jgi:hypothetical protein
MNSEALYYYREQSKAETLTPLVVGSRIAIYWDGDDEYYPCRVTTILDGLHHKYTVLYEEDETDLQYEEDLEKSKYLIWSGTDEQYAKERLTAWTVSDAKML